MDIGVYKRTFRRWAFDEKVEAQANDEKKKGKLGHVVQLIFQVSSDTLSVYDGRNHVPVYIQEDMVGSQARDEFAPTQYLQGRGRRQEDTWK